MHETLPPICYVTNIFPGDQPGWLLTHAEDVQVMLRDPDNFTTNGMGKWAQNIAEDWLVIPTEADPPIHSEYRTAPNTPLPPHKLPPPHAPPRQRPPPPLAPSPPPRPRALPTPFSPTPPTP